MGTLKRFISSSYNERNFYTVYYQKNVFLPEMLSIAILAAEMTNCTDFLSIK